ncbi:FAD binding domain-containing protein [Paracoccus salsus]|uniref:FAD binding domain-containing protein n=1 Tax=Paracoccus salsus TaxID=2911061 RepID=UPI001F3D92E0|nr:xanthine dehydrogenase family protein subunit M [Paracoccus salsus]MCF3973890.1 xanthine dehydrogenase family protein subunit M [Paracoccus salsus]
MREFTYSRAASLDQALGTHARPIAGATNLVDLMKLEVETPDALIDITRLDLSRIERAGDGVRIGALVPNADCAADPLIRRHWPVLSSAILAGASPQLRNKATTGGNLCQRTRCGYFTDLSTCCNKRTPGSGCDALKGVNHNHAILGTSDACIATYPGDMAVALAALDACVQIQGPDGMRQVPLREFHRLPGTAEAPDNVLQPGEIITAVTLPAPPPGRQIYRKVRERSSYAFALVSIAAVIKVESGLISHARLAFGGLAHKPWHDPAVEAALIGQPPGQAVFQRAADILLKDARGFGGNNFKIPLTRRTLAAVLIEATRD